MMFVEPVLQEGDFLVRTHHVEYCDGGILDPDDILSDLVEDKDKVRTAGEKGMVWHCSWFKSNKDLKEISEIALLDFTSL